MDETQGNLTIRLLLAIIFATALTARGLKKKSLRLNGAIAVSHVCSTMLVTLHLKSDDHHPPPLILIFVHT